MIMTLIITIMTVKEQNNTSYNKQTLSYSEDATTKIYFQEVLLNFILSVFLFVSGSLCLAFYNSTPLPSPWNSKKKEGIAMGVFCYISASFYVADTFVAIRNFCRKETETDAWKWWFLIVYVLTLLEKTGMLCR